LPVKAVLKYCGEILYEGVWLSWVWRREHREPSAVVAVPLRSAPHSLTYPAPSVRYSSAYGCSKWAQVGWCRSDVCLCVDSLFLTH